VFVYGEVLKDILKSYYLLKDTSSHFWASEWVAAESPEVGSVRDSEYMIHPHIGWR